MADRISTRPGRRGDVPTVRDQRRISLENLTDADWARVIELVDRYADLPLGAVDASVVAVAERLGITQVATLDHRDFSVVRPAHIDAFELLP